MNYNNNNQANNNVNFQQNYGVLGYTGNVAQNQQFFDKYLYENVQYYQQSNPINNQGYLPNQVFMQQNANQYIPGAIPTQK